MDWTLHSEGEIDGLILRLEADQAVQVRTSEDAALVEMRANDVAARAHALVESCRQRLQDDTDEIERLQAEQA